MQQQKHSVLAVQKTLFWWEDAAIYSDKMLFPACISAGRAALQLALGPQSHLQHHPEVPTGAASPSLSPSLPTAAADSSSLLHADPTSPCPNHSPIHLLHPGVTPANTATELALALRGWPGLLHPPPHSCASVISTCTKIIFCQAARLFVAAVSLSLPGDPAGHWEVH